VLLVKTMLLLAPVAMIVVSYLLWLRFYRLDEGRYAQIVEELRLRREAQPTGDDGRG
jgi:Na+/melibiose symporter-like transporter